MQTPQAVAMQPTLVALMHRDCKDKIREVAGEALQRLVKFLGPMYAALGESLRSKAAAALGNLATDSDVNAQAIAQLGEPSIADLGCLVPASGHQTCRAQERAD